MRSAILGFSLALMGCSPTSMAPVRPAPGDVLVVREVAFEVPVERQPFVQAFLAAPLAQFLPGTRDLPGVDHTEALTPAVYPAVGSVRLIVLKDKQTAHEEVLECDGQHLRSLVTEYTSHEAVPVAYTIGELTFEEVGSKTRVRWRSSVKLRDDVFPGWLGESGRDMFKSNFLDTTFAAYMDASVKAIRAFGASVPASPPRPPVSTTSP